MSTASYREMLKELKQEQLMIEQAEKEALIKKRLEEKPARVNDDSLRPVIAMINAQSPQNIYLSKTDTKRYLASQNIFTVDNVVLRDRILTVGEIVHVTMDILLDRDPKTYEQKEIMVTEQAEVISATRRYTEKVNRSGLTNLVLKKLSRK